jgi:hypothetical protein
LALPELPVKMLSCFKRAADWLTSRSRGLAKFEESQDAILDCLARIEHEQKQLRFLMERKIMKSLTDLEAKVTAGESVEDRVGALVDGLTAEVRTLAPDQDAIDELADALEARRQHLIDDVMAMPKRSEA